MSSRARRWGFRLFLVAAVVLIALTGRLSLGLTFPSASPTLDPTLAALATSLQYTVSPSATGTGALPPAPSVAAPTRTTLAGTFVVAARSNGHSHLWAFAPGEAEPIQLTTGTFDDFDPAISPDGLSVVFASNRRSGWDLYLLDLSTGNIAALTATLSYEGHPTWSPDGLWLAYEVYAGDDLDLWILRVDGSAAPIQLTNAPFLDASPDWGPDGRRIAFVSDRDGFPDVFVVNLDDPDETRRFANLTQSAGIAEADPVFSPDGQSVAYSARGDGLDFINVQPLGADGGDVRTLGLGIRPAWDPTGNTLAALLPGPLGSHLVIYPIGSSLLASLGVSPPENTNDFDWTPHGLPGQAYALAVPTATSAAAPASTAVQDVHLGLVRLPDVAAPNPQLSPLVVDAFSGLRAQAGQAVGWDVLGDLQNAFVGLNDPLPPGFAYNDWLYTGRGIALSAVAGQSGWLEVVREDYGVETYWRLFVRAVPQDGTRGEPLRVRPWDFSTRASGDPSAYDRGGSVKTSIPVGYYIDLTQLAADYRFERVPAMSNWRTYYPAARFNEFARTDGLTWLEAMLQIYPAEAIVTPTPFHTPTLTPTRTLRPTITPWWWRWLTPSPTYTPPAPTATVTP